MRLSPLILLFFGGLLLLTGCGPTMHTATGNVDFDGSPLPDGDILFRPNDKTIAPEGAKIKDGKFSIKVKPGAYTVEIQASKLVPLPAGQKGAMGETEMHQSYIPEKYNAKTELTADVGGPKELSFTLKSK